MTVSGRLVFEGTTLKPPADFAPYRVTLSSATPNRVTLGVQPTQIDATGAFKIEGVAPGQFRLNTITPPTPGQPAGTGWVVKAVLLEGRDLLDFPLEVRPGQNVSDVTVVFTDQTTELSGTLSSAAGAPISDLNIVLFPTSRDLWNGSRRMRGPTQPASDGRYRFTNLAAGEYYLAALTDVDQSDLGDPSFLEQVAQAAIKITIPFGERRVQDLRVR